MTKTAIVEKALKNPEFRKRLKENPTAVCRAEGADLPDGVNVQLIEFDPMEFHFFVGVSTKSPEVNAVLERAEKDSQFCQRLCDNPHEVLTELAGMQIAPGSKVIVHPASETQKYLMLPWQENEAAELSDSELETVSGGGAFKNFLNRFCGDTNIVIIDKTGQFTDYSDPSLGRGSMTIGNILS